jgi:hypothetical protein
MDFVTMLQNTFGGRELSVRVEASDEAPAEYRNSDGLLVREGITVPKGEENDPFYEARHLRNLAQAMKEADEGKFAKTFTPEEWKAFIAEQNKILA